MSFHPYLFFSNGQCAEAFRHYHEILGGELQVMTNADAPEGVDAMPGASPELVMHASIGLRGGFPWVPTTRPVMAARRSVWP